MQAQEIKEHLSKQFSGDYIEVTIDGSHVNLLIVSDQFEGISPVKKQQLVYAQLADLIADGTLHAVNMKTLTKAEYSA